MSRFSIGVAVSALAILLAASGAWAVAVDVTTPDNMGTGSGWYGAQENQEVEPGMMTGQRWDLEAFFWDYTARTLTMVGGSNFRTGVDGWASGDVFLAVDTVPNYGPTAIHGPGNPGVPAPHLVGGKWYSDFNFGYTYALDINWGDASATSFTYNAFQLPPGVPLEVADVAYAPPTNEGSNPYRYHSGGNPEPDPVGSGVATWAQLASDGEGAHYSMTFDFSGAEASWLFNGVLPEMDLYTHFTMQCGNDDLMGLAPDFSTPEPMSMVMLGCLGAGMLAARKARQWRKAAK